MAVYTVISKQQILQLCDQFQLGTWLHHAPISEGIENSNYRLQTKQGEYIITVFEELTADELPSYICLLTIYAKQGLPVNAAIADRQGDYFTLLAGKPIMLCHKLAGKHLHQPNITQCRAIGSALATLHSANSCDAFNQSPLRSFTGIRHHQWLIDLINRNKDSLNNADKQAAQQCLQQFLALNALNLPQGIIHADLFRDNALFVDNTLTGLLDFYNASHGYYIFDLAIVINDWCLSDGKHSLAHKNAVMDAYESIRPLTISEKHSLSNCLLFAALRFWLSRITTANEKRTTQSKPISLEKSADSMRELFHQLIKP